MTGGQRQHARLSPSSAHRWINCPGSVELCRGIPCKPSPYADEGTAAHLLAERCLRESSAAIRFKGDVIEVDCRLWEVTDEMIEAVQFYLDTVRGLALKGGISVERKIDLSWIPGLGGGTVDAVVFPERIIDLKYGAGVAVEVQDNPQLMLYALGVFGLGRQSVDVTIVQPRCAHPDGPVRSHTYSAMQLFDFALEVAAAAEATMWSVRTTNINEPGESVPPSLIPGDWCQFCPAKAVCPALRAEGEAAALAAFMPQNPQEIPPERLADLLGKARLLKTWIDAIEVHAHAEACAGRVATGYKLVAKIARRKWSASPDDVLAKVSEFGLTTDDIYKTELISPAAMDKLLKKNKGAIKPFITAVSGGTTLVPESDPRPPARLTGEEVFQIESEVE